MGTHETVQFGSHFLKEPNQTFYLSIYPPAFSDFEADQTQREAQESV